MQNYKWWYKKNIIYKKQNLKFYSKLLFKVNFPSINFLQGLKLRSNLKKNSNYFSSYEFSVMLTNSILRKLSFCVCRYSIFLECILNILWELHCIFGYCLIYKNNKTFIKIFLTQDLHNFSIINTIYAYKKNSIVNWAELQKLVIQEPGNIYILSTIFGFLDGKSSIKYGIGGSIIYRLTL